MNATNWVFRCADALSRASSRTPFDFCEAASLWIASTIIAGRVEARLPHGAIAPNVWALVLAPTGVAAKSTLLNAARDMVYAVEPSRLVTDLSTPEAVLDDLAACGQRGMVSDEFSLLVGSALRRDYQSGYLELLMRLFDRTPLTRRTRSGAVTVEAPALSLMAASTPSLMRPHLRDVRLWSSGWWGRFAILAAPERPQEWRESEDVATEMEALTGDLRRIAAALEHTSPKTPLTVTVAGEALAAYRAFDRAQYEAVCASGDDAMNALRVRAPAQAMKTALILAACDWGLAGGAREGARVPTVTAEHWSQAETTVRKWAEHARRVLEVAQADESDGLAERLLALLDRRDGRIKQNEALANLKVDVRRLQAALDELEARSLVTVEEVRNTNSTVTTWIKRRHPDDELAISDVMDIPS